MGLSLGRRKVNFEGERGLGLDNFNPSWGKGANLQLFVTSLLDVTRENNNRVY